MPLLVTSASGANGNGRGALLAFDRDGKPLGLFSEDSRIADPRGLAVEPKECLLFLNSANRVLALDTAGKIVRDTGVIAGLNPGGGTFGPGGRHYVGLRSARTILALPPDFKSAGEQVLPAGIVPFPRGFGFNAEGSLFLASGIGPGGEGDDAIVAFSPADRTRPDRLVEHDPDLSPLDLIVAPNGNVIVSSERPFGAPDAVTTVREYHPESGRLVRVFSATRGVSKAARAALRPRRQSLLRGSGRSGRIRFYQRPLPRPRHAISSAVRAGSRLLSAIADHRIDRISHRSRLYGGAKRLSL